MNWIQSIIMMFPGLPVILSLAAKASVLILILFASVFLTRRAAASTRCFLISAFLIMLPLLPLLTPLAPSWEMPLPEIIGARIVAPAPAGPTPAAVQMAREPLTSAPVPARTDKVTAASSVSYNLFVLVWLAGTVLVSGRVLLGAAVASTPKRRTTDVMGPALLRMERLAGRASTGIGLRRNIPVILKRSVRVPQVRGMLRPLIVLPAQAASWSDRQLMAIMLHELAHIKRHDHVMRPLAGLTASWLWFNPLVWFALSRMRHESEKACDDFVLRAGTNGVAYAEQLYVLCRDLRSSARLASAALMLVRRKELEERIMYMLSPRTDRRPMNLKRRLLVALLVALTAMPIVGVSGMKADPDLKDVTPDQHDGIMTTLAEFYSALSNGSDYETVRDRFLTADYFDNPDLTLENLTEAVKRTAFDNTISLITASAVSPAREVRGRVMSIHREGDEYIVTQHLNVMAQRVRGVITYEDEYGDIVTRPDPAANGARTVEDCRLVNSLGHQIRFRMEDGMWKISRFDDGVALMRMDTDNPYGPIFLFWMEDIDAQTTPFGPGIFKVIPLDVVPNASNAKFVLENR